MSKRKRKLGPKQWIEGAALDVMRPSLPKIVKPGDWVRMGGYLATTDKNYEHVRMKPRRVPKRMAAPWLWADGPVNAFYWREIDAWAPKDGFK
jgi:hypothetical protein